MDIRTQVMQALVEILHWDHRKAVAFMETLSEHECDDILEHVRKSNKPLVGVAAVVYRVRMRLAGSDNAAKQRAGKEANAHHKLLRAIPRSTVQRSDMLPPEQTQRTYYVSDEVASRRQDDGDNR